MKALPIKYNQVRMSELVTWDHCQDTLDGMEMHYANFIGGRAAFFSGNVVEFTDAANKVRQAIRAKMKKLGYDEDEE